MINYHPIQFNSNVDYFELYPIEPLKGKIVCFWEIATGDKSAEYLIIPDGCVDLIVDCTKNLESFVSPSLVSPTSIMLDRNKVYFGIRFYPGIFPRIVDINLSELNFQMIELCLIKADLYKKIQNSLYGCKSFHERVKI